MRMLLSAVLLVLVAASGCIELPLLRDTPKTAVPAAREQPVTASELTADNAYDIANALRDELDRDDLNQKPNTTDPAAKN